MKKTLSIISLIFLSACVQKAKENPTPIQSTKAETQQTTDLSQSERLNQWLS
jgi:PBP1b-binding outer membrane lipoprotein LpoB